MTTATGVLPSGEQEGRSSCLIESCGPHLDRKYIQCLA